VIVSRDGGARKARRRLPGDDPIVRRLRADLPPEMGGARPVEPGTTCYACSALTWPERQVRGKAGAGCSGLACAVVVA
jgi:hypothetical protein